MLRSCRLLLAGLAALLLALFPACACDEPTPGGEGGAGGASSPGGAGGDPSVERCDNALDDDADGAIDCDDPDCAASCTPDLPPFWAEGASLTLVRGNATSAELTFPAATDDQGIARYELFVDGVLQPGATAELTARALGLTPGAIHTLRIEAVDTAGQRSTNALELQHRALPADPRTSAPALAPGLSTDFAAGVAFLYEGDGAVQLGADPSAFDRRRVVVVRGRVLDRAGAPVPAVRVHAIGHPEFGYTLTRADGVFDLVVNGGGQVRLSYLAAGFLPVERAALTPWRDFVWLPDVTLTALDPIANAVSLGSATPQLAQGSLVTDEAGTRQTTVLVPPGTQGELVLADGSRLPLAEVTLRATEYTSGAAGPSAMPASLPPASAYTFAAELSLDEALAVGAERVEFSQALPVYLENFLQFPVGTVVPAGWLDRNTGVWQAGESGRVVEVLSVAGGLALLDTDGDGAEDAPDAWTALGITESERAQLATLYLPGETLWRVAVRHFTPWDFNWPWGVPADAIEPPAPEGEPHCDCEQKQAGSIILCESQVLLQPISVAGTSVGLTWSSGRSPGSRAGYSLDVPLTGETLPASLQGLRLAVSVAGQRFEAEPPLAPSQSVRIEWDGLDAWGRRVHGAQPVTVELTYLYPLAYAASREEFASSFDRVSASGQTLATRSDQQISLTRSWRGLLGQLGTESFGLGGLAVDAVHMYDPVSGALLRGDGTTRRLQPDGLGARVVAGGGPPRASPEDVGDGGPAREALLQQTSELAVGPDGTLFVGEYGGRIRAVGPDGVIRRFAGGGTAPAGEEPIPSLEATFRDLVDLEVESDGALLVAEDFRIRRVGTDGLVRTVAGTGSPGESADGALATTAAIGQPEGIAAGPDGSVYFVEDATVGRPDLLRRIRPDGTLETLAGAGSDAPTDGGRALTTALRDPTRVARGVDGSLYVATQGAVLRVLPDGSLRVAAGGPGTNRSEPEGDVRELRFGTIVGLDVARDDTLYVADRLDERVRAVRTDGRVVSVMGGGAAALEVDQLPQDVRFLVPRGLALGPDGDVFAADGHTPVVRRRAGLPPWQGEGDRVVPSEGGEELYVFEAGTGRHLRTVDARTGGVLLTIGWGEGGLASLTDAHGNSTTFERDASGTATAIVGPFGHRTELGYDANGFVSSVTDPTGAVERLAFRADGLLQSHTDPMGRVHAFDWDAEGRLATDESPAGGMIALAGTRSSGSIEVVTTSPLGRARTYRLRREGRLLVREAVAADGLVTASTESVSEQTRLAPDGTQTLVKLESDPALGAEARFPTRTELVFPSGLRAISTYTRETTLERRDDPLTVTSLTEVSTVNGHATTSVTSIDRTAGTQTTTTTSAEGRLVKVVADLTGLPTRLELPEREPLVLTWDGRGRLETMTQGPRIVEATWRADGGLEMLAELSGARSEVSFDYDAALRPVELTQADGGVVGLGWHADGLLASLTPPGRTAHGFTYDAFGREDVYTPPSAGAGAWSTDQDRDLDRMLSSVTRPGGEVLRAERDPATGRLLGVTSARGRHGIGYDAAGRVTSVSTPDGEGLLFGWDGPLGVREEWTGSVEGALARRFDAELHVDRLTVAGQEVTFTRDDDGLLTGVSHALGGVTLTRSPASGDVTGTTSGVVETVESTSRFGEPLGMTATASGAPVYGVALTWDDSGRVTEKRETVAGVTVVRSYDYDAGGRLERETEAGVTVGAWTFDGNGNRTSASDRAGATVAPTHDAQDRLLTYGATSFTYTRAGELLTRTSADGITTYDYDAFGALRSVALPDGRRVEYVIDGRHRRVGRKVDGALTHGWLYDGALRIVAELDGVGAVRSRFLYGERPNVPEAMVRDGRLYRILTDHLGSLRAVVDTAGGTVAQRMDHDAWGNVLADTNPGFVPFGFAGGLYDAATGLVRFGARDYDPSVGRWTAKDPIGFGGGDTSLYGYSGRAPTTRFDPPGLLAAGVQVAGGAELGFGGGVGASAGVGTIVDLSAWWPSNIGMMAFAGIGAFVGTPVFGNGGYPEITGAECGGDDRGLRGTFGEFSAGLGAGFFVSTANTGDDFGGLAQNFAINTPFMSIDLAVGTAITLSSSAGPSAGWSVSTFPTNTAAGSLSIR